MDHNRREFIKVFSTMAAAGMFASGLRFEAMMNHRIETWPEGLAI
jgi:hypothetical protein